jgi:hypothetical protein
MAKHGLVALTRGFSACEPNTYEAEGIKCYALAPWFANTNLVRSGIEMAKKDNLWQINGSSVQSMDDLASVTHMRALNVHEVGDAFMRSFEYDKVYNFKVLCQEKLNNSNLQTFQTGAVYAIIPDAPLIEIPDDKRLQFYGIVLFAREIGTRLNLNLFNTKHFYAIFLVLLYLAYYFFSSLLCWVF